MAWRRPFAAVPARKQDENSERSSSLVKVRELGAKCCGEPELLSVAVKDPLVVLSDLRDHHIGIDPRRERFGLLCLAWRNVYG